MEASCSLPTAEALEMEGLFGEEGRVLPSCPPGPSPLGFEAVLSRTPRGLVGGEAFYSFSYIFILTPFTSPTTAQKEHVGSRSVRSRVDK